MNHRLQASVLGFFSPSFLCESIKWGRGAGAEKELRPGGDPVRSKSKPIPLHLCALSMPARSQRSLPLRLPPPFQPASVALLPGDVSFPGHSQTIPQTSGPVPSLSASQGLYIPTSGFACWECFALLQGPFANVNVFLSLESSSADLPEHISHASPKIMPFAFPGVQAEAEPGVPAACGESSSTAAPGSRGGGARG